MTRFFALALAAWLAAPAQAAPTPLSPVARAPAEAPTEAVPPDEPLAVDGKVLYKQLRFEEWVGVGVLSATLSDLPALSNSAADDFSVPEGREWTIRRIVADGQDGGVTVPSFTVYILNDQGWGIPAWEVARYDGLVGRRSQGGTYSFDLPTPLKLGPGRYWLNVLANTAQSRGFWYWSINSVRRGEPAAMWNFGGGWGLCTDTWHPLATCLSDDSYQDLRFKLVGRER